MVMKEEIILNILVLRLASRNVVSVSFKGKIFNGYFPKNSIFLQPNFRMTFFNHHSTLKQALVLNILK